MHETTDDLDRLQSLLDAGHASAGSHHRSIFDDDHRVGAHDLVAMLTGVNVLNLATVTARCEPRVAPVDGFFFRGRFWFGSSPTSTRFRNIRRNPAVSGSITRGGETFLVLVHGVAVEMDKQGQEESGFADYARTTYDFDWDAAHPDAPYAWIDARTLLAFKRR